MIRTKSILWSFGVFLIAGFFATNYTLNHFYVNGGYMLDSGWFAYLSAHSTNWPASNPPSIGGTYFTTHFSPAFYVFTALHILLSAAGINVSDVSWFSITQGFWLALTASSIFVLLSSNSKSSAASNAFIAAASLIVAFNGVFLASIGFPHFEIAIPALLVAFFASHINGHPKTAIVLLCLGLLMREDAGLHYFGLFFLLAGYLYFAKGQLISKEIRFYSFLAVSCFAYSLLAIAIQKTYFNVGDNALARVYLGEPAFAHISLSFLQERLDFFARNRLYILAPIILAIFLSVYKRSWGLLVGVGAVLPWIIFSLLAISFQAGTLTSYYSFPVAIALFWPAIAYALLSQQKEGDLIKFRISTKDISVIALSSLVFYAGSYGNHDRSPWKNFWPKWIGQINSTHTSLNNFVTANGELKLIFDDSVASLLNSTATPLQWKYQISFSNDDIKTADAVLFQPGAWLTGRVKEVAGAAGFRYLCHLPNTHFAALSRLTNLKNCQAPEATDKPNIDTTADIFDYLPGWSHKESIGRWTIGAEVTLPAMKAGPYEKLCFKGHGYLPAPSSEILAEVYSEGSLLGRLEYNKSKPDGERCISAPSSRASDTQDPGIHLKLAGYSSPASHGLSTDDRLLGIFLEKIYFK
ncbi:hypothetical protein [Burkholderia multivorans]|uniref:hypothetical protein n=1 Tax=Burkholderia multivorans TaxID=87883 RepID=UPI001C26E097|nr:hypothetical protein [Burkholderia multivorans]MBU9575123.1 hypothetical protein [Burkholderia multivorans]